MTASSKWSHPKVDAWKEKSLRTNMEVGLEVSHWQGWRTEKRLCLWYSMMLSETRYRYE